jgi:hypothetical protein
MEYLKIISQIILAIFLLISTFHWVRTRFWVPKYIHYLAAFMFIVGSFLEFMAYSLRLAWDENSETNKKVCI